MRGAELIKYQVIGLIMCTTVYISVENYWQVVAVLFPSMIVFHPCRAEAEKASAFHDFSVLTLHHGSHECFIFHALSLPYALCGRLDKSGWAACQNSSYL